MIERLMCDVCCVTWTAGVVLDDGVGWQLRLCFDCDKEQEQRLYALAHQVVKYANDNRSDWHCDHCNKALDPNGKGENAAHWVSLEGNPPIKSSELFWSNRNPPFWKANRLDFCANCYTDVWIAGHKKIIAEMTKESPMRMIRRNKTATCTRRFK